MNQLSRSAVALVSVCALMLAFAASAFADAADPTVAVPGQIPNPVHSKVTFDGQGNTVVTVWGGTWNGDPNTDTSVAPYAGTQPGQVIEIGWQWTTHGSDCNNDRNGTGVAIDWNDPVGTVLKTGLPWELGVAGPTASNLNPLDNTVHPTPVLAPLPGAPAPLFGTPSKVIAQAPESSARYNDTSVRANWRGGCGIYGAHTNVPLPNGGTLTKSYNTGVWGPFTHVYPASKQDAIQVCPLMYDVHGNQASFDTQLASIPNGDKEIVAAGSNPDHNGDNSAESNGASPAGNGCFAVVIPKITTNASNPPNGQHALVGGTITDTATVVGTKPTGTVTFKLYKRAGQNATCTAGELKATVSQTISNPAQNNTVLVTSPGVDTSNFGAGLYDWVASYSGDANNQPVTGNCGDANEVSQVDKRSPSITTLLSAGNGGHIAVGGSASDSATLTGATANAGGTVTYTVYSNSSCTAGARDAGTKTVTNGVVPNSNTLSFPNAGQFYWQAVYSGDANNNGATSVCTEELLNVDAAPTLTTDAGGPYSLGPNGTVTLHDVATLTGGSAGASGTITFRLFSDVNCTVQVGQTSVVPVNNGADGKSYTSGDVTVNKAGTYHWTAAYSGDANNGPATSGCGAANENPVVVGLAIQKVADDNSVETGEQVGFKIIVTGSGPAKGVTLNDKLPSGPSGNILIWAISGPVTGDVVPNCSISGAAGAQALTCSAVDLGGGADGNTPQSYTVHVVSSTSASGPGFTMTNTATATAQNDGSVSDDDTIEVVDLEIEKHADQNQVATGTQIGYVITVTGSGPARNVVLNDPLPGGPVGNELNWSIQGPISGDVTPKCQISGLPNAQTLRCDPVTLGGGADFSTPQHYTVHIVSATNPNGPAFSIKNISTASSSNHKDVVDDDTAAGDTNPIGPGTGNTIEVAAQLVLPERVTPGAAKLSGPTGCVAKAFSARVRGTKIATVVFRIDGKVVKRVRNTKNATTIALRVNPAKFRIGVHRMVVRTTFQAGSGTRAKTMRLSFQRCAKKLAAPRFTG